MFLADLRGAYRGWRHSDRNRNCLILLDNVDTPAGRRFLTALTDERALLDHDQRSVPCDPMVVAW